LNRECVATEKLDGANVGITIADDFQTYRVNSRTKYISYKDDYKGFARWIEENREEVLKLGPGRHNGEWWGSGLGRGYGLKEKRFSLFNTAIWGDDAVRPKCCHVVPVLGRGTDIRVVTENALTLLREKGSQAAPGYMDPEGVVIFHTASSSLFKVTLKNDESPKGAQAE
jgi:hypothetical protein